MPQELHENASSILLKRRLRALTNRYAIEILQSLNSDVGDIVPELGWGDVVEGVIRLLLQQRKTTNMHGRESHSEALYNETRARLLSGGTLYDTMNGLIEVGLVQATGKSIKKQRRFRITQDGRLALNSLLTMEQALALPDGELREAAEILLRHKNFVTVLPAQRQFLSQISEVKGNLIIQMPPGSGKTFLAMTIVLNRLLRGERCIYLSPYIALTRQIIDEYGLLLERMGFRYERHDGQSHVEPALLEKADFIVAIYESALDSFLQDHEWTKTLRLAVVDELTELDSQIDSVQVHNLGTDRSARLDCLIALLKTRCQIIALSSRFGDTEIVAHWLNADVFRPSVTLQPDEFIVKRTEEGVEIASTDGSYTARINSESPVDAVMEHIRKYQREVILFVAGSRRGAETLAKSLAERYPQPVSQDLVKDIMLIPSTPAARRLKAVLQKGVAFHHAGLDIELRGTLERMIRAGLIKTVVSTTGITAGTSFPFDCVAILLTPTSGMSMKLTRAKYLQIAGRIGEYHLARDGGHVYLIFEPPIRQFQDVDELQSVLVHGPIDPLRPGMMDSVLLASLVIREAKRLSRFTREELRVASLQTVEATLAAIVRQESIEVIRKQFETLFDWLVAQGYIEQREHEFCLSREVELANDAGLNLIDLASTRDVLSRIGADSDVGSLVNVVLRFRLVQQCRPRTVIPMGIELDMTGLSEPADWYIESVKRRTDIKTGLLIRWISEEPVDSVLGDTEISVTETDSRDEYNEGQEVDEGDLVTLVHRASDAARIISEFLRRGGDVARSHRFRTLSIQLKHGCREDVADTDLFEMVLTLQNQHERTLTREEARCLFNHGYRSIEDIVRRDMNVSRTGFARDRFVKNSGLEPSLAKQVYKTAIAVLRSRRMKRDGGGGSVTAREERGVISETGPMNSPTDQTPREDLPHDVGSG